MIQTKYAWFLKGPYSGLWRPFTKREKSSEQISHSVRNFFVTFLFEFFFCNFLSGWWGREASDLTGLVLNSAMVINLLVQTLHNLN